MRNILIHIVLVLIILSCNKSQKNFIQNNERNQKKNCIGKELFQCISNYIQENESKIALYDENNNLLDSVYYSLFFFNEDTSNYFTMWESFLLADSRNISIEKNPSIDTNYAYYTILGRQVFIINRRGTTNILFTSCDEKSIQEKDIPNINKKEAPIYDGSFYPATFRYYIKDSCIVIEKMDTTFLYFSPGWAEYEKYQKKLQNGK